ncbi:MULTISPECIES: preprotein translocase subunit YajC [Nocardiaceae]|uniref:Preprotein translocase subunit YajC n=1 Tax=Rhodococcoides corynebacterioides TaxID=53972 RepID=A0ABS2KS00_9NOCA|nr:MULTISPECIES: preprotein translocase subunit YajC [Rhodococcus]MBM7414735.1 preprotein translocase subunit YajC [Rhodococcus corynebacterioides]MBP1117197.1 preprotein translocase subunit YajC [Rhodococcus sp. PvP016]
MELLFPLLVLALLVPMFLGIRRQKREVAKTVELQEALSIGDRVLTTSGLHGLVDGLTETTVDLEIAPGIITTWSRAVVRDVLPDEDELAESGTENAGLTSDFEDHSDAGSRVDSLENGLGGADDGRSQARLTKE